MGPWISSLQATMLCKYGNIAVKLERKIRNHFNDFMIQWANPKSNRLYLIECRLCGGAAFGYWGRWDEGHAKITAIPDFNRYCEIHKMTPDTIYEHGLCYREIVLDKRMLRKCNDIHCILISPGHGGLMKERADGVEELSITAAFLGC